MPLLRTMPLVQLFLHIDTSSHLSRVLYCSAHFSALPTLYIPHSFCLPHPLHILHHIQLSNQIIHIYIKQQWIYDSLVTIQHLPKITNSHHFPPEHTSYYLHKNSALLSPIFLQLHTLLASATCHAINSIICLFQIHKRPNQNTSLPFAKYFSHTCMTANSWSMHPLPCLNPHCSSPSAHSVPALTLLISTLSYRLPIVQSTN